MNGIEIANTAAIDCIEVDTSTGEGWVSGVLSNSEQPDILPVGFPVFAYFRDGGPKGMDWHSRGPLPAGQTCHERPLLYDPFEIQRGSYVVR